MTVLDTFYLLFKSDAPQATRDVKALDAAQAQLEKNSVKDLIAKSKAKKDQLAIDKELARAQKDAADTAEESGKKFVKLVESAAAAATAYISFGAIKNGINNAAALNSQLFVQSRLLGSNASLLRQYGAAVQAAGGNRGDFLGTAQQIFDKASSIGQSVDLGTYLRNVHNRVRGLSAAGAEFQFQREGVNFDSGLKTLLRSSDQDFNKFMADAAENTKNEAKAAETAYKYEQQLSETTQALNNLFTTLGTAILPTVITALEGFRKILNGLSGNPDAAVGGTLAGIGGIGLVGGNVLRALGLGAAGGAASGIGALSALASAPWLGSAAGTAIGNYIKGKRATRAQQGGNEKASYSFWIAQGLTPAAAAGMVAQEREESGFDPGARGDDGTAFGSFQWHQKRRRAIFAGTGIDIASAGHDDQLKAAAWELKNMGLWDQLNAQPTAAAAGAFASRRFEGAAGSSGNSDIEAMRRGGVAAGIASSYSSSGDRTVNLHVGDIAVHTQATDAHGISAGIGQSLDSHLRGLVGNWNDGVDY